MTEPLKQVFFAVQNSMPDTLWNTPEYKAALKKSIALDNELRGLLDDRGKALLRDLQNMDSDLQTTERQALFVWTLRLGFELAAL